MRLNSAGATAVGALLAALGGVWCVGGPVAVGKAPVPKSTLREGVIVVPIRNDGLAELFKPDGTPVRMPGLGAAKGGWRPRLSPDGRRLLLVKWGSPNGVAQPRVWAEHYLQVLDLDKEAPKPVVLASVFLAHAAWAPDGSKVYGSSINPDKANAPVLPGQPAPWVSWTFDPQTQTTTPLALPTGHRIADVSPDGKTLLTVQDDVRDFLSDRSYLVPLATLKPQPVSDEPFTGMRFSPDGRRVIGSRYGHRKYQLVIVTPADRSVVVVWLPEEVRSPSHVCWSPNGKRIAYVWSEEVTPPAPPGPGPQSWYLSRVNVADSDGLNVKTIVRRGPDRVIEGIDWR